MTPRAHRRKLAAAALAVAGVIIYLWMLFASRRGVDSPWETAWGVDLKHRDSPPWLVGTFWELQWAVACAALVLLAALCAATEGLELWKRPPLHKGPRMFRVGDNASRVGLLALLLVACRIISLHAVSHEVGGRRGRAPSAKAWFCQNDDKIRCLKGHAHQFGWDAMVPMALLGVPAQQFSPPFRALGLSHEAAIAFHRVLGRATLILVTLHFGLYALAWGIAGGWGRVWDETFQVCAHAGRVHGGEAFRSRCTGVANFFGFMAWCVGVVIGVTSLYAVRRRSYALFMVAHQLHWAWWFFGVLHWAGMLSFVAPALVFFLADFARRRVAERTARCAVAATSDAAMATVLVPMPGFPNAQLTGGVVRLRCRDVSWMWHPFTIAGAADGAAIVHVFDAGGWTRAFCGLAARQPVVELEVRGPLIAPAAFARRAAEAARGRRTLVVAAGSGLAPAAAFLRAVRAARPESRGAPHVRLVAICRTASQLESLDAFCLPATGRLADEPAWVQRAGDAAEPWLSSEIHLTRAPDAPAATHTVVEKATRPSAGRVVVRRDGERLFAVAAPWPTDADATATTTASPLFPDADETKESPPAPAPPGPSGAAGGDDAAAVLGSGIGFLAAAYAVAWREDAPFARHGKYLFDRRKNGNPNVVSGGLSLVVCAAAAFVGAVIALAVTACIRRRRRRSYRSASDVELKDVDAGAAAELVFATCGARPDLGDILRRANEELGADAGVLIGGPQRLVDGLEDRLKGRVVERMTWAM